MDISPFFSYEILTNTIKQLKWQKLVNDEEMIDQITAAVLNILLKRAELKGLFDYDRLEYVFEVIPTINTDEKY